MKTIYKIARTELKTLFYSPIAWLIIVIFAFQTGFVFTEIFDSMVRREILGWGQHMATLNTFGGISGTFTIVQQYLFLYIPLLTMGVMSREFSSGSIKLLYSSPLTSRQIVLGKYLALVIYAFVLIAILLVYSVFAASGIRHADIPLICTGLLGLFLLTCAYAAIGLFMSSLTSYTVVSAMGTLAIFASLSYVKTIGQEIEVVRDITYWLAISGRSDTFIAGLITSEDVLYFLIVIVLFIGFTMIKMHSGRQRQSGVITFGKYAALFIAAMIVGYCSSMPKLMAYYDSTFTKFNTLTKSSQEVMKKLPQGITMTTYTNMLDENFWIATPSMYKVDVDRFKQYLRFRPDLRIKYKYYYEKTDNKDLLKQYPTLNSDQLIDTLVKLYDWRFDIEPYKNIKKEVNLEDEKFHFVRHIKTDDGQEAFLRVFDDLQRLPNETEITAAFKRLVIDKRPTMGFVTGHGERKSNGGEDRGYNMFTQEKSFRFALVNQGFDFQEVSLERPVPEQVSILFLAELRKPLSQNEIENLNNYINAGNNLIIAGEPGRGDIMNPLLAPLGVEFLDGILVKPSKNFQPNLVLQLPTVEASKLSYHFRGIRRNEQLLPMSSAAALGFTSDKGYKVTPVFTTDSTGGWIEKETTNFIDDTVRLNPAAGEIEASYPTVLALSRKINNKEQRIMVMGDADCLSNGELMMNRKDVSAANFSFISGMFFWITNEELPIDMRRPPSPDRSLRLGKTSWMISNMFLKWLFPFGLIAVGTIIWIKRKRR